MINPDPEGTVLVCVRILDAKIEPAGAHRYIVERTDAAGLHEMTVKELCFDRDGRPWLWPDSDDPAFQEPLAADGNDGDAIEIRATGIDLNFITKPTHTYVFLDVCR